MRKFDIIRRRGASIFFFAITVMVPIVSEGSESLPGDVNFKLSNCSSVPISISLTKAIHECNTTPSTTLKVGNVESEHTSELKGRSEEVASVVFPASKAVGKVSDKRGSGGNEAYLGDIYDVLCGILYIIGISWLAGCFRFFWRKQA